MPRASPFLIRLSYSEAAELQRRAAKYTSPYFQVQRAKMILMSAEGLSNDEIARRLDTRRDVVSMWRKRFFTERLAGLEERARPGSSPDFFPPSWWCKSKLGRVNSPPFTNSRCPVGVQRTWHEKSVKPV